MFDVYRSEHYVKQLQGHKNVKYKVCYKIVWRICGKEEATEEEEKKLEYLLINVCIFNS